MPVDVSEFRGEWKAWVNGTITENQRRSLPKTRVEMNEFVANHPTEAAKMLTMYKSLCGKIGL